MTSTVTSGNQIRLMRHMTPFHQFKWCARDQANGIASIGKSKYCSQLDLFPNVRFFHCNEYENSPWTILNLGYSPTFNFKNFQFKTFDSKRESKRERTCLTVRIGENIE